MRREKMSGTGEAQTTGGRRAVILIPARRGSTRLPDKLLLSETGRPLIVHTWQRAKEAQAASSGLITGVFVATDDRRIREAVQAVGGQAIMTDPECRSGTDRLAQAVRREGLNHDLVVNLQGDEPEMEVEPILLVLRLLVAAWSRPQFVAATAAAELVGKEAERALDDPAAVKVVTGAPVPENPSPEHAGDTQPLGWEALYFSRAPLPHVRAPGGQSPSPRMLLHLGLYAYRRDFLLRFAELEPRELERAECLEQLRILEHGFRLLVGKVPSAPPGIDVGEDYEAFVKRATGGPKPRWPGERRRPSATGH